MNVQQALAEVKNLDFQNPGAWPGWAHVAGAIVAGILLLGVGFWFFVRPKFPVLEAAEQQELALRADFERKQKKVAGLDAYKAQLAEMERSFGTMLRQLPSKTEVANLLLDISQTRVASSLEEELFQPQPEIPKEFYAEVPNRIVLVGGYHELGTFVSGVAALPRIVTIDEVDLRPADPKDPSGDDLRLTAFAKTYRYLDDSEIAAAEAEAAEAAKGRRR